MCCLYLPSQGLIWSLYLYSASYDSLLCQSFQAKTTGCVCWVGQTCLYRPGVQRQAGQTGNLDRASSTTTHNTSTIPALGISIYGDSRE